MIGQLLAAARPRFKNRGYPIPAKKTAQTEVCAVITTGDRLGDQNAGKGTPLAGEMSSRNVPTGISAGTSLTDPSAMAA